MTASRKGRGKSFFHELKKSRTLLLMLLPAAVTIFIFAYLPMGGMILAFKNFNYKDGIWGSPWTKGIFDNFKFFFLSGKAFSVTANTFCIIYLSLPSIHFLQSCLRLF